MQPEQQQRIMGYFIEEAKDHLNTIEQGLLSLQSTIEDPEMLNEIFRAAHSVKGGAAMLGLNSIQQTAHRLEDYFKILQESQLTPDSQLESLFLRVFDTLEALIEQLQGPFGLTDEATTRIMSEAEPVFEELKAHLQQLLEKEPSATVVKAEAPKPTKVLQEPEELTPLLTPSQFTKDNTQVLPATFKRDVLIELREMLQLFKQQDSLEHRIALQAHCDCLIKLGEKSDLPGWGELLETSKAAIAHNPNSYRQLAGLIIKEIKQAQELVLANRSVEIVPSEQLQALVPTPAVSEETTAFDSQEQESFLRADSIFETDGDVNSVTTNFTNSSDTYIPSPDTYIQNDIWEDLNSQELTQDRLVTQPESYSSSSSTSEFQSTARNLEFGSANPVSSLTDLGEPEVGMAELNSLADIFEGQTPDLDQTWQEEEIITLDDKSFAPNSGNASNMDDQSDFSDLISDIDGLDMPSGEVSPSDELMGWFGDEASDEDAIPSHESVAFLFDEPHTETQPSTTASTPLESLRVSEFSDVLFEADSPEPLETPSSHADEIADLFGDSFFEDESSLTENSDLVSDVNGRSELQHQDDNLFAQPTMEGLDFSLNGQNVLNERWAGDEKSTFAFEDSFTLDPYDGSSDENRLDEVADAKSGLDFSDLLSISDSSIPAENLVSSDELLVGDEQGAFDFDGLAFDESAEDFVSLDEFSDSTASADQLLLDDEQGAFNFDGLALDESPEEFVSLNEFSDNTASALDWEEENENVLDAVADEFEWDFPDTATTAQGTELEADNQAKDTIEHWDISSSLEETSHAESFLDLDEPDFDIDDSVLAELNREAESIDDINLAAPEELAELSTTGLTSDFDLDLDAVASTSPFELDEESNGTIDDFDLFGDEPLPDAVNVAAASSIETSEETAFPSLESSDLLLDQSTEDTEELTFDELSLDAFEEFNLGSPEESEAIDLDALNEFIDATSEASSTFAIDSSLNFEDFSLVPPSPTTDNVASSQTSAPQTEAEDLTALLGEETIPSIDTLDSSQENLFDTEISLEELESADGEAADAWLDWEGADVQQATENLEDLLGAESSSVTQSQNWDVLEIAQGSQLDGESAPVLSEAWELQAEDDETTADLVLDWDTASDSDNLAALEELTETSLQSSEFDDLEAMLSEAAMPVASLESADADIFDDLEALLGEQTPADADQPVAPVRSAALDADAVEDDLGLDKLLEEADKTIGGPPTVTPSQGSARSPLRPTRPGRIEQTMRVPVKHLDSLSNLVGELVVNRNSLEQDQERLRQFLDNLSHQVLALGDVGARMQDLYERSLLESSLLASRQGYRSPIHSDHSSGHQHATGVEYDPLEMDRFTGFHLLSQEMIELIVRVRESAADIEFLVDETDQVARMLRQITTQLQEGLTRSRMVPFAQTADRLPRAVRDISLKLNKQAELYIEGRETLIDKMILEHLYDPLTHLVNNAITHGIELPEIRKAARKPPVGKITLRAFHQGNQTVISISDDGAGINPERVRQKAIEQKLITPTEGKTLTPVDLYDFLFHPGFSTKDKADDFSGRGVGMDVVRTSLSEMRGTIHIDSTIGKGTTFTIRLPLTLSICKALCCLSDKARIAFPMDGVEDMMDVPNDRVQMNSEGQTCIQWRDALLPFKHLTELLTYNRHLSRGTVYGGKREDDMISIVVLRSAGNFIAIQVDQVLGEQEIVIKQLEGPAPKPVGIAGATVLGDGRIMPIADVLELIDLSMGRIRKDGPVTLWSREDTYKQIPEEVPETKLEPLVLIVDDSITVRELLSMTFSKAGYRVEQARDGQEAWEKLRSGLPCEIVFCDIEMPRMDGLELLSRLQKDENLNHLPIAMLTSRGADRHRQMASQLGASGYFTKPYLEEVLLDAAQRMIKGEVLFSSSANA
jgi:chemotaxis protein histidine kinase CheA/ActR/RegA family two-component response regulator